MMNKKIEGLTKQLEATQEQLKVLRKAEEPLVTKKVVKSTAPEQTKYVVPTDDEEEEDAAEEDDEPLFIEKEDEAEPLLAEKEEEPLDESDVVPSKARTKGKK